MGLWARALYTWSVIYIYTCMGQYLYLRRNLFYVKLNQIPVSHWSAQFEEHVCSVSDLEGYFRIRILIWIGRWRAFRIRIRILLNMYFRIRFCIRVEINLFYQVKGKKKFINHLEVLNNRTAILFSLIFVVFKFLLTRKFYILDMN